MSNQSSSHSSLVSKSYLVTKHQSGDQSGMAELQIAMLIDRLSEAGWHNALCASWTKELYRPAGDDDIALELATVQIDGDTSNCYLLNGNSISPSQRLLLQRRLSERQAVLDAAVSYDEELWLKRQTAESVTLLSFDEAVYAVCNGTANTHAMLSEQFAESDDYGKLYTASSDGSLREYDVAN